jgi:hypothetical protein
MRQEKKNFCMTQKKFLHFFFFGVYFFSKLSAKKKNERKKGLCWCTFFVDNQNKKWND